MPKSLPLAFIPLLLCASCTTTFQYSTLSSPDIIKNDRHEFVVENDSLKLVYNFSGQNGPIHIFIQNKLGVPVYIDWQRSALIVNEKARPYAPAEINIEGNYGGSSYRTSGYGVVTSGQIQATAVLPPTIDFIPPRSIINKYPQYVTSGFWAIPDTAFRKLKYTLTDGWAVNVKKATFSEATSPLRFRSYITYMIGDTGTRPFAIEHSFFVSEVMNTGSGPIEMSVNSSHRGDQYYSIRY